MISSAHSPPWTHLERDRANALIDLAFAEDLGTGVDLTSWALIAPEARGAARFSARSAGVVAGLPVLELITDKFLGRVAYRRLIDDGAVVEPGATVAEIAGPIRDLLLLERTALNVLQHLSGIATLTARFVAAVHGTRAIILDTRKTLPGWRALAKYAVRMGGGHNHRMGLYDGVLIKDNHLAGLAGESDPIGRAVELARLRTPEGTIVEIEVDSLEQLDRALAARPEIILLDNFDVERASEAVVRRDRVAPGVRLEISGGVTLLTVAGLAATGVDRISVGALTHSAPALDLGLDWVATHAREDLQV